MHGVNGIENCLVITIIYGFEPFEQQRLFCLTLVTRYCGSLVGNDYFWLARDVLVMEDAFYFYHKRIFSRKVLIAYEISKCLVGMNLSPLLYVLRISIIMKKLTINWMNLLMTSPMNKKL
jgi:hypothetical protein